MKTAPVEEEYKKNKDLKKEDVETLMAWMETQPHLPNISELDTILFLHSCYYKLEATKQTIDTYYTCTTNCDEIFARWNPKEEQLRKAMELMVYQPLPDHTDDGSKIIFVKFMDSDASKFSCSDQIKIFYMSTKLWLSQEGTAPGHLLVMDISGLCTGHLFRLNPIVLKKFFYFLQEAIPFRLKGFHFYDCTPIIDRLMAIIRPFIKEGMLFMYTKERREELFQHVPKRCLPQEYGGQAPSVKELHETMKNRLLDNVEYLQEVERTERVDEKLRPDQKGNCTIS